VPLIWGLDAVVACSPSATVSVSSLKSGQAGLQEVEATMKAPQLSSIAERSGILMPAILRPCQFYWKKSYDLAHLDLS
jgi:hypothetical protein